MNPLYRLAVKNLTRNPKRSVLTTTSMVAGVGVLVIGQAFIGGVNENIVVSSEEGTVGHVLARPAGYPVTGRYAPLDKLIDVNPAARALLDSEAVAWTGRVQFTPTAIHGADSVRVRAVGFDPEGDPAVFPRAHWKTEGAFAASDLDEVTVSPSVARLLTVKPGDRIVLQVRTHRGAINALEVKVSGIVSTGNLGLDQLGIFVPKALTEKLTGADAPTHVAVKLRRRADAPDFKPRLQAALGPKVEVATLQEETAELLSLQAVRQKALGVVVLILLALSAFGMANTFLMAAYERTREVGTLRAMGMTEASVVLLFVAEGALIGLFGSLVGAAWGGSLAAWWSTHPLNFAELEKSSNGNLAISTLVYTQFRPGVVVAAVILGVVVAILASWYPARVASSMRPADAVRA